MYDVDVTGKRKRGATETRLVDFAETFGDPRSSGLTRLESGSSGTNYCGHDQTEFRSLVDFPGISEDSCS